jgi:hypothetical protein
MTRVGLLELLRTDPELREAVLAIVEYDIRRFGRLAVELHRIRRPDETPPPYDASSEA